ncbi:myosin heavy chain, clone 203-like isoform X2 [Euwallacea fornicatus]|uniref:myosin heavy chain, clone 203-like isoform X2 n=1 Tax=Euwallacea fornicatus TaxID=995702 RepID=UPI00338FEA5D
MKQSQSSAKSDPSRKDKLPNSKGKFSEPSTSEGQHQRRSTDRQNPEKSHCSKQLCVKENNVYKQRSISPGLSPESQQTRLSHLEEPSLTDLASKSRKQRSRSTVTKHQPWGQLLNKPSGKDDSPFGNFDPLRTLHFLARELQTNMQTRLPEATNLQEIINAMNLTLKRIPPEVVSNVHLQENPRSCANKDLICSEENVPVKTTSKYSQSRDFTEFQRLIEGSTMKLETSCRQLEMMCGQLKDEKVSLETMLQTERSNSYLLRRRVDEVENAYENLLSKLSKKDEELSHLKSSFETLQLKLEGKNALVPDSQVANVELKKSKSLTEREIQKLEHQLRLCAMEKEKYLAILEVRNQQIYEIRNEMIQLQESVNEQLMELHNYATSSSPGDIVGRPGIQEK